MDVWGHRALVCVLVVVGCLVAVGPGAIVAADAGTVQNEDASAAVATAAQNDEPQTAALNEADEIHVTIAVNENRSATVTVDYRYELEGGDNESSVDWEELVADIESNPDAYTEAENESWQDTLERGMNATDREMELSAFTVATDNSSTPVEIGRVRFQFEWSSFAYGEPKYLEAGDALVGFTLVDHARLTIAWPESYSATGVQPEPTMRGETSVQWDGSEVEFGDDEPRVELVENGTDGGTGEEEFGGLSWQTGVVIGAIAAALVGTVGLVGWLLRRDRAGEPIANGAESTGPVEPAGGVAERTPPPELLSNEEQVLRLLERRGGRLKQQQVVSELDWTEAKTSQVVTGLREADEIEVFRIGRENVLVLPDEE